MQRVPVESSDIVSIGYDVKARVLEVEFKEGRVYQYLDVEPDVHQRFMRADSFGEYFFSSINKHYRYKRMNDAPQARVPGKLAFVSGNANKFRDLCAACQPFGIEVERLDLPVDEIQSHDPQRIIAHKAKEAYKLAARPVVVQDTFWNILALRGFPGAYMRQVAEWLKPEDFLALMRDKPDRTAIRTHSVAYYDGKHLKIFNKDFTGVVANEPRGTGGSFHQVFITAGETRTNAEIRALEGRSSIPPDQSAWHEFAQWYSRWHRIVSKVDP